MKTRLIKGIKFLAIAEMILLLLVFILMWRQLGTEEAIQNASDVFVMVITNGTFHFIAGFIAGFIWLLGYFKKVYTDDGWQKMTKKVVTYLLIPLALLFSSFKLLGWYRFSENFVWEKDEAVLNTDSIAVNRFDIDGKIRGIHTFGWLRKAEKSLDRLLENNVEWIVQVPFGYQHTTNSPIVKYDKRDTLNRRNGSDSSYIDITKNARIRGIRTIMKPHLWMSNAGEDDWRNAINFNSEEDWKIWESNYRSFIMYFAELAQEQDMEMLCIGVELRSTVQAREAFWRSLIEDIRGIYDGKLTYGANWWEEYKEVPFWDALDYIGVQAYFPLSTSNKPTFEMIKDGWMVHRDDIQSFSEKWDKPVLFTEMGYRNTEDSAVKPWEWPESLRSQFVKASVETQMHCYEAFFETFWKEDWFAGVLFWDWRIPRDNKQRTASITFSPKGKPAEQTMAKWFGRVYR